MPCKNKTLHHEKGLGGVGRSFTIGQCITERLIFPACMKYLVIPSCDEIYTLAAKPSLFVSVSLNLDIGVSAPPAMKHTPKIRSEMEAAPRSSLLTLLTLFMPLTMFTLLTMLTLFALLIWFTLLP